MAARRLPSILPPLSWEESLRVTRIHLAAEVLPAGAGLVRNPPFRMPHHSASAEGIIGGGKVPRPGEVSLAHEGVLFLDEAAELSTALLQTLREPGPGQGNVLLPVLEISRYWRRLGGALLDRVDLRIPLEPVRFQDMSRDTTEGESGISVARKVSEAARMQRERYRDFTFSRNAHIPPGLVDRFCPLDPESRSALLDASERLRLSSRAFHSILKTARTIADLEACERIGKDHLLEAVQYRRYCEGDVYWNYK